MISQHPDSLAGAKVAAVIAQFDVLRTELVGVYGPWVPTEVHIGFRDTDCPKCDAFPNRYDYAAIWLCNCHASFSLTELRHEMVHAMCPSQRGSALEEAMADHFALLGVSGHLTHLIASHPRYATNYARWRHLAARAAEIREMRKTCLQVSTASPQLVARALGVTEQEATLALGPFL